MKVVYARQPLPERDARGLFPNSIFLVGPTPRLLGERWWQPKFLDFRKPADSWRPEALRLLESMGFDGTVLVPEDEGWGRMNPENSRQQIWWEIDGMGGASAIAIWLARVFPLMPAFTTNSEWGGGHYEQA